MPRHASARFLRIPRSVALATLVTAVSFLLSSHYASAQESYLASAFYGGVSVFDVATSNSIEVVNAGANNYSLAVRREPAARVSLSTGQYLSVIDLTIQREIQRNAGGGLLPLRSAVGLSVGRKNDRPGDLRPRRPDRVDRIVLQGIR